MRALFSWVSARLPWYTLTKPGSSRMIRFGFPGPVTTVPSPIGPRMAALSATGTAMPPRGVGAAIGDQDDQAVRALGAPGTSHDR